MTSSWNRSPPTNRATLAAVLTGLAVTLGADELTEGDQEAAVRQWVEDWGDKWWERYHSDYVALYPGGRSDRYHDQYVEKILPYFPENRTENWTITGKRYIYDGDWFAVEWFFQSTFVKSGDVQKEATLAFGRIEDDRLIEWIEYFDDAVGEYQRQGALPLYDSDEDPYPWPENVPLFRKYRP